MCRRFEAGAAPRLQTERLRLRPFEAGDLDAVFALYSDREVNTFLPWFPVRTREEAARCLQALRGERWCWALCLRGEDAPIGYVNVSADESRDLGYALARAHWGRGLAAEACRAVIAYLRDQGVPYVTATHDVANPRSGAVMVKVGLHYQYTYREQWQPKDISVLFRLYQLNLDGDEARVYRKYWETYPEHFVEEGLA